MGRIALVLLVVSGLFTSPIALGKEWPDQQVRIVLPYPPGGASDVTARLLATKMGQAWDKTVVVENRPGANGIIANEMVAKAAPDGYTILMANLGPNGINPAVYSKLPYDTMKDFSPVILTTVVPLIIVTSTDSPYKTLAQVIAAAKANPESIKFGSAGNGSSNHLAGELLAMMTNVKLLHIPYKGDAPSITDVMGGQIQMALPTALAAVPHVKGGKLRALAVTSNKRIASLPDVPTVNEALDMVGYEAVSWGGFMVPTGTPVEVILKINGETNKALQTPEISDKLQAQGAEVIGGTPQAFDTFLRQELVKWKRVADSAKVRLD